MIWSTDDPRLARFLVWPETAPQWQPMPIGADMAAPPKPLGGRKRDVGEARPGAVARAKARSKRRARR